MLGAQLGGLASSPSTPPPAAQVAYHGPTEAVLPFFQTLHLECPPRRGVADFLQEVTTPSDQHVRARLVGAGPAGKAALRAEGALRSAPLPTCPPLPPPCSGAEILGRDGGGQAVPFHQRSHDPGGPHEDGALAAPGG